MSDSITVFSFYPYDVLQHSKVYLLQLDVLWLRKKKSCVHRIAKSELNDVTYLLIS